MAMQFKKATREKVKLKLAISGPAGSGKTDNALAMARQIVGPEGRIALIDTENESASLYGDLYDFETLDLAPPYTSQRYIEAIDAAVEGGFDILIIDSLSHQWEGSGGILDRKQTEERRGGANVNGFALWNKYKEEHRRFVAHVLHAPIHIVCCLRSRQEYVQTEKNGKKVVEKLGMAPITGEGMEFEFSVVFDLNMDHYATATKDRTGLFAEQSIDVRVDRPGERIKTWLAAGSEPAPRAAADAEMTLSVAAAMTLTRKDGSVMVLGEADDDELRRLMARATAHNRPKILRATRLLLDDRLAQSVATQHDKEMMQSVRDMPDEDRAEMEGLLQSSAAAYRAATDTEHSTTDTSNHDAESMTLATASRLVIKTKSGSSYFLGEAEPEQVARVRQRAVDRNDARIVAACDVIIADRIAMEAEMSHADARPYSDGTPVTIAGNAPVAPTAAAADGAVTNTTHELVTEDVA